jgi:hypothetical protein
MPPDCNVVPPDECHQKCLTDYENTAAKCGQIQEESARKSCNTVAYYTYKSCKDACQKLLDSCDEKYQDCINYAPKSCLKESGGKSQCARCQERCNAGDSPSAACKKCKF